MLSIDESKKLSCYKEFPKGSMKKLLEMYEVKKGDNALVLCDTGRRGRRACPRLGKTVYNSLKRKGCSVSITVRKDSGTLQYAPQKINRAVFSLGKNDFLVSFSSGMVPYFHKKGKRIATKKLMNDKGFKMASASGLASVLPARENKFLKAFTHNQRDVNSLNKKLGAALRRADRIRITCPRGTDLTLKKGKRPVLSNNGDWRKYSTNYPVGEVYVPPLENSANGTAYITSLRILGDAYLKKKPVKIVFKKGLLVESSSKKLMKALKKLECFNKSKGFRNYKTGPYTIAEFGIGTNRAASLIGLMLTDEKVFGTCHVAIGSNAHFGGKTMINGHMDQVITKPTIWLGKKKIMEKGRLLI